MCPSCAPASQTWSSSLTLLLPGDLMISMVCDANFAHTRARHCSPRVGSCDGSCYAETSSLTPHAPLRNALTSKRNYRNALSHTHVQTRSTTRVSSTTCALRCWGPRRSSSRRSLAGSLSRRVTSTYSSSFPASFPHGSRARAVHVELFWGGGGPFLANSTHRRVIPQTHLLHRSPRHPHAISTPSPRHLHAISAPPRRCSRTTRRSTKSLCASGSRRCQKNQFFCLSLNVAPPLLPFANLGDVFEFRFSAATTGKGQEHKKHTHTQASADAHFLAFSFF